ncbi:MAG: transcriptional repressor LexA [Candidatus Polarisedimenticolia bacterium]
MLPTRGQRRILDAFRALVDENGRAPTLMEVARRCGLASPATVHKHLRLLEERGLLRRRGRRRILLKPEATARPAVAAPLLGTIAAGRPIDAVEDPSPVSLPAGLLRSGRSFVLRVKGDSMVGEGILDGDYVVVAERPTARLGEIVVALLPGGEATLKTLKRERGRVMLRPANPRHRPIRVRPSDLRIQGVVTALVRRYA